MESFPFVHRSIVRYRDADAFGHVNNAVYLTYLEEARNAYLRELGLVREIADIAMILARCEIDYRSQLEVAETVEVGVRPVRMGNKSFELEYELWAGGRLAAEARTVLAGYDYEKDVTVTIPDRWRELLTPAEVPA